jgi:hypothetical protein
VCVCVLTRTRVVGVCVCVLTRTRVVDIQIGEQVLKVTGRHGLTAPDVGQRCKGLVPV